MNLGTRNVLDVGHVALVSAGSIIEVANAARVSREGEQSGDLVEANELCRKLLKWGHLSPFEFCHYTFEVKAPLFVARQWMRHRVGHSYMEKSLRYCTVENAEFYIPDWCEQANLYRNSYQESLKHYRWLLDEKQPPELARNVLPMGLYTTFHWCCNARSLMDFLSKRLRDEAQVEIRAYAWAVWELWRDVSPVAVWFTQDKKWLSMADEARELVTLPREQHEL